MATGLRAAVRFCAVGVAVSGAMIACGGATTGGLGDGNGGGGGGGVSTVSGSVANTSFTVASQLAAIEPASTSCTSGGSGGSSSSSSGAGSSGSSGGFGDDGGETCTSSGQVVIVLLTNRADVDCALAQSEVSSGANVQFASFDELELAVANPNGNVATGTYPIVSTNAGVFSGAGAIFGSTSATCSALVDAQGTSGTVTFTQIGSGGVSGSYSVTFGAQGTLTGSFDVSMCEIPDGGTVSSGGPPTCQ